MQQSCVAALRGAAAGEEAAGREHRVGGLSGLHGGNANREQRRVAAGCWQAVQGAHRRGLGRTVSARRAAFRGEGGGGGGGGGGACEWEGWAREGGAGVAGMRVRCGGVGGGGRGAQAASRGRGPLAGGCCGGATERWERSSSAAAYESASGWPRMGGAEAAGRRRECLGAANAPTGAAASNCSLL